MKLIDNISLSVLEKVILKGIKEQEEKGRNNKSISKGQPKEDETL